MIKRFFILLLAIVASVGMSWATENSIVINGTPQVGDNSISLTYYFDPANVPGITGYAPTLKVKCVTDNIWDEEWLSLSEISSGTTTVTLNTLGSFQAGKEYAICYAYNNGSWVDEVFQSFSFPAAPDPTTWTSLSVGDVIKVGDQLSPSVEWESANDYGVIKPAWAPYTLLRANIAQENEWDDPVVTEAEDGAYYVFKFTHPTSGTSYLLSNSAKSPLLAATATSDGLEVTNVGDDYGTPAFTFAVHDGGGSSAPSWVLAGDAWDEDTKTLTVNSNPGYEAYYQNTQIEHLIISDGVTTIGESAFDECTALLSVVIGNDVTNIEAYAFDECRAMTSLTIGNKVQTIGESAFGSCEELTSVTIPNSVTSIGESAFDTCDKISSLTIGNSVQTIGEDAFTNCSALTDVTIPASVENIGNWFFRNCANLTTITCEATTPPTLGTKAFFDCDKLTHIYVPAASVATYKAATNWSDSASIISAIPAVPIPCTPADLGKVLCTDGSIYATVSEATAASKTAAAVIAYVDTENGKALALALADESGTMEWEAAKTTAPAHTPVVSNGTWTLASKDDWNNMITAAGGYEALRDGFSGVGGTNMQQDKYWSSTPENANAWCYYFNYGMWTDGYVDNPCRVRACLAFDIPAAPAYETVMNLINSIGSVVLTAECKEKIDAARAAYDALSTEDKALVTNYTTLTTAEAAFENVMNIWLSGDCDAILWKDTTLTVRKHAGEGNGAMADYNYMSRAPWYSSHWTSPQPSDIVIKSVTIEEGVTHLGDYAFAWMSEMKTATIPLSVTTIPEDAFYWSKAVDDIYLTVADTANLTWALPYSADAQFKPSKATLCHVPADLLTAYQEKFDALNMTFVGDLDPITPLTPEQQQALDAVKGLINAIPSPVVYTPACEEAIDAARAAYDALTPDMLKQLVSNYATLTAAETTYANMKDVVVVEAKINNIPQPVTLKLATRDSIEGARAAYDALTADQQALVSNYQTLLDAEAELATLNPGGGMPAGALNGKFTINAGGDQIAFSKGNLQATTEDFGEHWTWGFAANQWDNIGNAIANNKINGNGTVSANGTVDLFGWSTAATYYGINNSYKAVDYIGDFVDWGPNMGAGWRTLTKDEWNYLIENNTKGRATVNDKNGYIFLPNDWSGPAFTPDPDNFTTNVYSGDDWTAMENAGAVFLPSGPARNGTAALIAMDAKYSSSTSLNNDTSYVFTIYYNQSQSACTGTNRAYGCMVRLVTAGGGATPLDSAQAVKDLIEAIPQPVVYTPECGTAIKAAREALDALSDEAKALFNEADTAALPAAEAAYAGLLAEKVAPVIAAIDAVPATPLTPENTKLSEYNKVTDARALYDALTDEEKAAVDNYDKLTAAEAAFAAIPSVGSETVITWDKNTGIEKISGTTTSPAYEGITISINGGGFGPQDDMLRFNIAGLGLSFEFANTLGGNFQKIVISSTNAMPSTPLAGMGEGWAASNENKTATWTGDAATVKIWDGLTATSYWDVNTIQFTLGETVSATEAAQAAVDLINAIPDPVTLADSCVNAIQSAREAVTALGENASLIDASDMAKLTDAEAALTALNQAEADKVIAKINNIPLPVELKLATRDSIESARAAYDALNAAQQALVTNYQTLLDAEAALAEKNKGGSASVDIVWDINTGIANVDPNTTSPAYEGITITTGNGNRFYQTTIDPIMLRFFFTGGAGRYAFAKEDGTHFTKVELISSVAMSEWLLDPSRIGTDWVVSDENKKATWIGDADTVKIWDGAGATSWVDVDSIVFTVSGTATPLDSAQVVKDLIDAIPTPVEYPTSGPAIAAALVAYNQLSDAAKGALDDADVQKMTDAATQYAALDAIAAIEAIPAEIVYDPAVKAAIETAREKYDALIDASKALVDDEVVAKLTNAEEAWAILVAKIEHNVSYIGKDGELKNEKVALLHIPDPAPDFNGYEFVRWDVKAGDFLEEGLRVKAVYTPIITTNPVAYDSLMYNGAEQTLITAGVAKEGHIEYRINDGVWSAELPKATFAAAYVVYYKLVREGHEDYIADSIVSIIAKAPVTYTAPTAVDSLVYTAANQTLIAAGQTNDGTFEYSLDPTLLDSWKTALPQAKDAGTYSVYYRVQGDLNHLDSVAATPVAVTIAKAELTATADDKNVIYGDTVPTYTVTYAGWQGDDDATVLTGDIAFACTYAPTSNVGEYTITPSGATATNYDITFVNGKVTVAQAALMITADDKNVIYGDTVPTYTATYSGWKNSDDASVVSNLAYTCEYAPTSNVGEYTIVPSGATATNYNISYTNGKVTVAKAALMITADDKNVIYGDAVPTYTATYSGWKNADDASVVSGLVYTCEYAPTSNVDEYTIVPSGATATNYNISYTNGKVTVAKAALMITADDKNVIYGDAVPAFTATYSGWKNSDDASVVSNLAYTCEYAPTSNVGEYTITPNGATAQNYAISYTNGKVTVAQATLTVTAENKSVTYGDAAPAFTATYSGWKNTDDASVVSGLTLTSEYLVTSNVGTYDIVPANATALNYTFVYVNGTLTVNKAALMITADDKSVEYGEVAPAFTASYSGWKNADDASVVSGLTLTSEYLVTSNVGTYDIVPANATATNYAISYTNGTLTVNQAPLMITADDKSVIYGDEHPEFTASYSGWKNSDDASVVSGLTLTSEYLVTSNVGTYDIVPANATATNYAISYTNGTLTVNQAALTITAENKEMIYGDEHPEFTVTYAGWKNTDDESVVSGLKYTTPYAPGSPIGTYTINPNSATALNYAITFVDGTLTVTKAHVYVSDAEVHPAKFADGHANAEVINNGVLNGIKVNDPIAHITTAAFSSAEVAENLTITLFYELTGSATLLNNYYLEPTQEVFTTEGVIIEPFIPDDDHQPEEGEQVEVQEGIDVYAYGYCDGSGYSLKYHLNSGNPDQYKIEFEDSRFTDVDWTNLEITGKDGTIDIEIPVDMPTGDYSMTVYFRDSRFDWLESQAFTVTFHVNLPETYVRPLFDNVIALIDTCHCLTDIQWYWRANSSDTWVAIPGANGYYYHSDTKLEGEYFVSAKMDGVPTYTCGQSDMETLYGGGQKAPAAIVRAYPNPVVNTTTVTIENSLEWNHNLRIVDLMGSEIFNTTFEGNETSVEMSGYPQGNYMISVDGIVVKVMKQ